MKFVSFDTTVRRICDMMDDPTAKNYPRVAKTLKIALDQLNLHVFPTFKTDYLTVQSNYTVDLPADMASICKVGVLSPKNTIKIFGLNEGLVPREETIDCGCEAVENSPNATGSSTCAACTFHGCFFDNFNYGELYGYRRPQFQNGQWRPDYENNRIILSSGTDVVVGGRVLVEYKSDMTSDNKLIQIPMDAFTMLMYRVFQLNSSHSSPGKAREYAQFFKREYDTYKQFNSHISLKDIIAAFRGSKMSAIKR